jgi:CRISPR-associated protein Cas2
MGADKRWRLICYDIRDPARWRAVYNLVRGRGHRVQYSIYRARLDAQQVEQLRWELAQAMAEEDALLIVDLCPTCATNVISRNHVEGWQDAVPRFRVIGGTLHAPADVDDDGTPDNEDPEEIRPPLVD